MALECIPFEEGSPIGISDIGMGIIVSIVAVVTTLVGIATTIAGEVERKKTDKAKRAAAKLGKPIKPPFFFTSIAARDKGVNVPAAYTTEGIRTALRGGILPVGYSEEQLDKVGFGPEVKVYQTAILQSDISSRKSIGKLLDQLLKALDSQSAADLTAAGVDPTFVTRIRDVAKRASAASATNLIDAEELQDTIAEIKTLTDAVEGEQNLREQLKDLDTQQLKASADRNSDVLNLARRAFIPGFVMGMMQGAEKPTA